VTSSNMDEFYWNVIPAGWDLPVSNVRVVVHSPSDAKQTTCYTGKKYDTPCTSHTSSESMATYTQDSLPPGQGLTVAGGWPVGTFPGAKIKLIWTSRNPFGLTRGGAYWAYGAAVATILSVPFWFWLRRMGRDKQYVNLPPGTLPRHGDKVKTKRMEVQDAPVRFVPPEGVPPRLAGACVREYTADQDITATIIDLAVRGYIHIEQGLGDDLSLRRTNADPMTLNPSERITYARLFQKGPMITKTQMSGEAFYPTYSEIKSDLESEFNSQKWYKHDSLTASSRYLGIGCMIACSGPLFAIPLGVFFAEEGYPGIGWLTVPFAVLGFGVFALIQRGAARTPFGSAVAFQCLGFKKYLQTAKVDQIRWEEGQDIFSQYLPYAVSFGCADHWAFIFQELVDRGSPVPQPTWYSSDSGFAYPVWRSIVHSIDNIRRSIADSETAAAVLASSEDSEFDDDVDVDDSEDGEVPTK